MSSNKRLRLSSPSSVTPEVSASSSSFQNSFKYDVFISFRGGDTRKNFVDHLYEALKDKGIYTYKDDERIEQGKTIDNQLIQAIRGSRYFIIVFSQNYASSSWCLDELAEIMDCQKTSEQTAYPVFLDVEPTHVRKQSGAFGEAFLENKNKDAAGKWIDALKGAAGLAGWELKNTLDGHEAKFIKKIVQQISLELRSINFSFDEKLVGMETRARDVISSLEIGIDEVRMIGIKGMGGAGKTTTARAVFDHLYNDFEAKSFVENVREVSTTLGLKKLQKQVLSDVLKEEVNVNGVTDGKNMMKERMCGKKVLLVLDDVDHIDQLEALASGQPNWFKPGSRIIITTRDEQVLVAHKVHLIHDINLLSNKEAICLLSRYAFGREIPSQGYEELSRKVVRYAAGLPLTVKVLGSFLCGKDMVEWEDAIERLKKIPLKETQEKLELSYMSLEDDYKEIFLDIACMLKRYPKKEAMRILESCGFHARNGLKVLQQRSLITIYAYKDEEYLVMHDHIEEMGKNIVRREQPDEPNKHSRLWINEEIEDILANDKGTEKTRCLKLNKSRVNVRIVMKGLRKMKNLQYLDVNFRYCDIDDYDFATRCLKLNKSRCLNDTRQYFPNSLKYLRCEKYPFLYLPKTFEANNLVGLEMNSTRMVQLWKERKKKVLTKLKFLSLSHSKLTTFDFAVTPNLERLSLNESFNLKKLCMPASCQKLKHLCISKSKLRTFDLGLTPNLETLSLKGCAQFEELHVSAACSYLKLLNLSKTRLRSLDLELIPNLVSLFINDCSDFEELHLSAACPNLKSLNLSRTRLRSLDLDQLIPNLKILYLRGSRLRSLDLELIPNLERLDLEKCNELVEINTPIGCLKKLVYLNLRGCALLEKLPEDIGEFECLEELHLSATRIKHLPDSICMLKHLKYLNLRGCALLEKLPEDIGEFECLEELNLSATTIKHLPDSICMLKHLKYLGLSRCALLEKLPEDLGRLECLKKLDISDTGISHLPQSIFGLKGLLIIASSKLLELYDFPSEIKTYKWEPGAFYTVL